MHYDAILIDAGTGNLLSVFNALRYLGFSILPTNKPDEIKQGHRIILPGVGAFGKFMEGLHASCLVDILKEIFLRGDPILGICVGMQAFFGLSEEMGNHPGLNLLSGKVIGFPKTIGLTIPHTGWNQINFHRSCPLITNLHHGDYVYFNHSYFCEPIKIDDVIGVTEYGINFSSIVQRDNLFGVQFHPEKSQKVGLNILENFMRL